ncbi:MAG: transposase, partial [Pseudomonadota bacterium]
KRPFAGPKAVLAYLGRYTHRVAISNRRLVAIDERGGTFRYKDYRRNGADRYRTMTLDGPEFIRRFLLHVLPKGFHRIRHYGFLAGADRRAAIDRIRDLLAAQNDDANDQTAADPRPPCPDCGGRMVTIEVFEPGREPLRAQPRAPPRKERFA